MEVPENMKRMILKMNGISGIVETMGAIFNDRGGKVTHLLHIYFVSVFCMKEKVNMRNALKKGLSLLLAVFMTGAVHPVYAVRAEDIDKTRLYEFIRET